MAKFTYSKTTQDLTHAFVRITYDDGKTVEPLSKHYNGLKRTGLKSAEVISFDGDSLYKLPIVNDKLIYRKRNLVRGLAGGENGFDSPKRAIILATQGKIVFFWDSEEIKELTSWDKVEPYTCPTLREEEK